MRLLGLIVLMLPWHVLAVTVTNTANCTSSSSTLTTSCALGTASAGDLIVAISKTQNSSGIAAPTFTSASSCVWHQAVAPTSIASGLSFNSTMYYCLIPTGGTESVQVAWTGQSGGVFTDLSAMIWHTTGAWNNPAFDRSSVQLNTTSSTVSNSGSTGLATQNANDLVIGVSENFNQAETWGTYAGWTSITGASRNTTGVYAKAVTTKAIQSASIPLSTADYNAGFLAAFQASDVVDCSGGDCGLIQSANSANETSDYDHIALSNVVPGDTLVYMVYHNNWSGSGTTTMVDSTGKNTWYPCSTNVKGSSSVSMYDIQYASGFGMSCFYTIAANAGGTVTGQPTATDCAGPSGCTFLGGWFGEFKGALKYLGWANNVGVSSTASTNNASCGGMGNWSSQFPLAVCSVAAASGTATAASGWTLFNTTNGAAQYIVDSTGAAYAPNMTLSGANIPYGAMSVIFK